MNRTNTTVLALAALGALLTGCGATTPPPSVSIDGEAVDLGENPAVECRTEDGIRFIFVTPEEPASETHGLALQFLPDDGDAPDELDVVAYEDADGNAVIYQKGTGRAPTITQDENSYTVTGRGINVDAGELPDHSESRGFDIIVTCP